MAQPSPARPAPTGRRNALVAGAAGRLGEALLAEVIACPRYPAVTVLTTGPLGSTVVGLKGLSLRALQVAAADASLPAKSPELDVFICWGDAEDPLGRAYHRRDAIYLEIGTADDLRAVAAAAASLRARRLLLVAPLRAWQQISAAGRMLPQAMEMELASLPIPVVVIMRPTTEQQVPTSRPKGSLQRFARFYLSQLRFMLPAVTQSLRSTEIARAALAVMAEADAPGLSVVSLEEIRQHARRPRGFKPGAAPQGRANGDEPGSHPLAAASDDASRLHHPGPDHE